MLKKLVFFLSICVLFSGGLLVIYVLNPQSSRFVYILQCYHMGLGKAIPKTVFDTCQKYAIPVPDNFSGTWKHWNFNGTLDLSAEYLNGKRHGKSYLYHTKNSTLSSVALYKDDAFIATLAAYNENGNLFIVREYDLQTFLPHGRWWRKYKGVPEKVSHYVNGVLQEDKPLSDDVPPPNYSGIWESYPSRDQAANARVLYNSGVKIIGLFYDKKRQLTSIHLYLNNKTFCHIKSVGFLSKSPANKAIEFFKDGKLVGLIDDSNRFNGNTEENILYENTKSEIMDKITESQFKQMGLEKAEFTTDVW